MASDLDRDPRWIRLHEAGWTCPCCGARHDGVFDLASSRPYHWRDGAGTRADPGAPAAGDNFLSDDLCVVDGQHFFVRGVLRLPIIGAPGESFGYGCWSSLSKHNFGVYSDSFDGDRQGSLGPWQGWFSNRLKGYPDTLKLKCRVVPQDGRKRPHITLEATSHPLAIEERQGITFERLLEIYAVNGHDLTMALSP